MRNLKMENMYLLEGNLMKTHKPSLNIIFDGGYAPLVDYKSKVLCTGSYLIIKRFAKKISYDDIQEKSIILDPLSDLTIKNLRAQFKRIAHIVAIDCPYSYITSAHKKIQNLILKKKNIYSVKIPKLKATSPLFQNVKNEFLSTSEALLSTLYILGYYKYAEEVASLFPWGKEFLYLNFLHPTNMRTWTYTKKIIDKLLEEVIILTKNYFAEDIINICLIGSLRYGEIKKHQDIDILVLIKNNKDKVSLTERGDYNFEGCSSRSPMVNTESPLEAYVRGEDACFTNITKYKNYHFILKNVIAKYNQKFSDINFSFSIGARPYWIDTSTSKSVIHLHLFGPIEKDTFSQLFSNDKIFAVHMINTSQCLYGKDLRGLFRACRPITQQDLKKTLSKLIYRIEHSISTIENAQNFIKTVKSYVGIPTAINVFNGFFSDEKILNIKYFLKTYPKYEEFKNSLIYAYYVKDLTPHAFNDEELKNLKQEILKFIKVISNDFL